MRQYSPSGVEQVLQVGARVRWGFFIEMNHLYKMMSVVRLMAFTVDELSRQFFFGMSMLFLKGTASSAVNMKNVAVVCLFVCLHFVVVRGTRWPNRTASTRRHLKTICESDDQTWVFYAP